MISENVAHQEIPALVIKRSLTHPWIVFLLLAILATLIYSNTFSASFHLDDTQNIVENSQIKNLSNLLDLSGSRYVGFLFFSFNYRIGQLNVFGYHLVNLLIHITNSFLVYCLVLMLLRIPPPPLTPHSSRLTVASGIAIATSVLFAVHPIQTQAVTYIVQRFASLATLFYLLSLFLYLKWRLAEQTSRPRSLYYAGALLCTVVAMKTKEISFTLPFILLLVEAIFFRSLTRRQCIALIPFLLTLPIIPLSSRPEQYGDAKTGFALQTTDISRWDYLFTQFRVVMTYLRLLLFPVHQNLDYDYPISHSLLEPRVFFSFLFLLALLTLSLYLLFRQPWPSHASRLAAFGILWFFLTLSIESSIIPIQDVIFEHRLYLPSVGFLLSFVSGGSLVISGLMRRWRVVGLIAIGVLVIILSVATYQRNLIWKDELSLWTDVVQKSPNKARGHNNLGVAYQMQGRIDEAIQEYKTALTLKSDYADPHNNLGFAYQGLGRLDEAIQEYKTALTLNPQYTKAYSNLGFAYLEQGRIPEALSAFKGRLN